MSDTNSQGPAEDPAKRGAKKTPADITLAEFIAAIFGDLPEGETVLLAKQVKLGGAFLNTPDISEAQAWLDHTGRKSAGSAVYFNISTVAAPPEGEKLRRRKQDCVAVMCFVADDIGTKVDDTDVAPSWVMETSAGSFQYGYLLEAVEPDQHGLFEAFVREAGARGITDPGAEGVNRLMRTPHSINLKEGKGRWASRLVEWAPERSWTLRELAEAFGIDLDSLTVEARGVPPSMGGGAVAQPEAGGVDPLLDWLVAEGLVEKDGGGEWVNVRCPNAAVHTTGESAAGYSPLGRGGEEWGMTRNWKCQHAHCRDWDFKKFSEWAVKQGAPDCLGYDPIPLLQSEYVFVQEIKGVVSLKSRAAGMPCDIPWDNFAKMHAEKIGKPLASIASRFLADRKTIKVARIAHAPTLEDKLFIEGADGKRSINLYVPPSWQETDEKPELLIEHINYLFPDDKERRLFWAWLAFKIQNPQKRSYAILMVTNRAQGIGRSLLHSLLKKMLPHRVGMAEFNVLVGKGGNGEKTYNDWGVGNQFVFVHEVKNTNREDFYAGYETFKGHVDNTPTDMSVNVKYGSKGIKTMHFNLLMATNHFDALHIPEEDRRVAVLTNPDTRRSDAEYAALHNELENPNGREHIRLYWYLRRMDVKAMLAGTGWDLIRAPMTEAKRRMIEANQSEQDQVEQYVMDNHPADFVTVQTLETAVRDASIKLSANATLVDPGKLVNRVWRKLRDAPWVNNSNGFRPRVGADREQIRVKALRTVKKWPPEDSDWSALVGGHEDSNIVKMVNARPGGFFK